MNKDYARIRAVLLLTGFLTVTAFVVGVYGIRGGVR